MTALIVGTALALAALAYVLWPLLVASERPTPAMSPEPGEEHTTAAGLSVDELAESEIRAARGERRACPICGLRPEVSPRYCSRCGAPLA